MEDMYGPILLVMGIPGAILMVADFVDTCIKQDVPAAANRLVYPLNEFADEEGKKSWERGDILRPMPRRFSDWSGFGHSAGAGAAAGAAAGGTDGNGRGISRGDF